MKNQVSHQELPRERLMRNGANALSTMELLAIIFGSGSKEKNVFDMAQDLVGSLKGGVKDLAQIRLEELTAIEGIGVGKAAQVLAVVELGRRVHMGSMPEKLKVTTPKDVAHVLINELKHHKQEHFVVVLLDTKNQWIAMETITIGTLNASLVHPREVFKPAIKRSANSIILAHNHPSGITDPSQEDLNLTTRLIESGKILGIQVVDHIIVGEMGYCSLKELGFV